jgi:hypothetical protein
MSSVIRAQGPAWTDNRSYLHSLPIKEYQIVDFFLPKLKDEVMKIKPVQKQTRAGQRTRFKAISASRPLRKSRRPSAPPSSLPSSPLSPSEEDTGVPTSVSLTRYPPRRTANVVPSPSASSLLPAVPAWSHLPLSSACCSWLVLKTPTQPRLVPPRPSRTLSRPPLSPSQTPTAVSPRTCGKRPSSAKALSRSSAMCCVRERGTRGFRAIMGLFQHYWVTA